MKFQSLVLTKLIKLWQMLYFDATTPNLLPFSLSLHKLKLFFLIVS